MQCADFIHFWLSITVDRVQNVYGLGACMEFEWPLSGSGRSIYRVFKPDSKTLNRYIVYIMTMIFLDLINR